MSDLTAAVIRAHLGSARLPGKIMLPVMGKPLLAHLIERLRRVAGLDAIVLATTEQQCDTILEDLAQRAGILCFRGSNDDVMTRVLLAAKHFDIGTIVDVTSDCPLADPATIAAVLEKYWTEDLDYASNILLRSYPRGLDVQVYSRDALSRAWATTDDKADREHVTLYLYEHPETFRLGNVTAPPGMERAKRRLTLDTPEDYMVIRAVFEGLYATDPAFDYPAVVRFLDAHPEVATLNGGITQKKPRAHDHTENARRALGLGDPAVQPR